MCCVTGGIGQEMIQVPLYFVTFCTLYELIECYCRALVCVRTNSAQVAAMNIERLKCILYAGDGMEFFTLTQDCVFLAGQLIESCFGAV